MTVLTYTCNDIHHSKLTHIIHFVCTFGMSIVDFTACANIQPYDMRVSGDSQ